MDSRRLTEGRTSDPAGKGMNIPETTFMPRRPVYERLLKRKHFMPLKPPTRREYEDALDVLIEDERDELEAEAIEIIREFDELAEADSA